MAELISYLQHAQSAYHVTDYAADRLAEAGFKCLSAKESFDLEAGKSYYVRPYPTCLFAFRLPRELEAGELGVHMALAHTDAPCFKVKPVMELPVMAGCRRINVEPYGGMLKRTWFDRPLGLAGSVILQGQDPFEPREVLFDSRTPWFVIPSIAPHMDREAEKREIDAQKDLMPLYATQTSEDFITHLAGALGVLPEEILDFELNLYIAEEPSFVGTQGEFLLSSRIDNVSSVAALTEALLSTGESKHLSVIALFDNEEVGSTSKQGADSHLLTWMLEKIFESQVMKHAGADMKNALLSGGMLSVDVAHAKHPNYPDKADSTSAVCMGEGFVLKTSSNQRYVTDARLSGILTALSRQNGIQMQKQAGKNTIPGGTTIGPMESAFLPIPAVDVGIPVLAMHSAAELCCPGDYESLRQMLEIWL